MKQDIDEFTKARIDAELDEIAPSVAEFNDSLTDLMSDVRDSGLDAANKRLIELGVNEIAMEDGRLTTINLFLGYIVGSMTRFGMTRDTISQVLHHAWHMESYFNRGDLFPDNVSVPARDQLVRLLRVCLDEAVMFVNDRANVPVVAWFTMELALDVFKRAGIPLPCDEPPTPSPSAS